MNRVVQSKIQALSSTTEQQMIDFKDSIIGKINSENYETYENIVVNNYIEELESYSIKVKINFIYAVDANDFHDWLKTNISNNSNIFENAQTKIHDCMHGKDENKPCMVGDIWQL